MSLEKHKTNIKRKGIRILLAAILLGLLLIHFLVPRAITEIRNPIFGLLKKASPKQKPFAKTGLNGKLIEANSIDGLKLHGYVSYTDDSEPKGTVVLLHGIRANKAHFYNMSKKLARFGYHSVAIDHRAHGESEGTHCTFGAKEKLDITAWIDTLLEDEKLEGPIGVWGQSLGGAIALQAMEQDQRIRFGIVESTFSDFRQITHDYVRRLGGFDPRFITDYLVDRAGSIANFNPEEVKPKASCGHIKAPVLILHGDKDVHINMSYGKDNYDALPDNNGSFIPIENANHTNVWKIGGEQLFSQILEFMDQQTEIIREIDQ